MGLRDILLFALVFGSLPFILKHTHIGIYVWSWVSYMNPHRMTWGAAYGFPFAQVVAIAFFISFLFNKEPKSLPKHPIIYLWLFFIFWMLLTTLNAVYFNTAWDQFIKVFKIQLVVLLSLVVLRSEDRIRTLIWVIFASVGFFGVKGGWYTITTGGGGRVYGPDGGFIQENNALAIALLMVLPLGFYLLKNEITKTWQKYLMYLCLVLILFSVVGSFSRGAFLAIGAVAVYFWWVSKNKIQTLIFVVPLLFLAFAFMPDHWTNRMETISTYDEDSSAQGRINAWKYSIAVANDSLVGYGFNAWSKSLYAKHGLYVDRAYVAHSIYFSVLAEHGWPGLIMFVALFHMGWRMANKIIKATHGIERWQWTASLSAMIKVSFIAYASGGAFLSLSYFDLPWHLLAIVILMYDLLLREGLIEQKRTFARNSISQTV